jgi:hypothetical protein
MLARGVRMLYCLVRVCLDVNFVPAGDTYLET